MIKRTLITSAILLVLTLAFLFIKSSPQIKNVKIGDQNELIECTYKSKKRNFILCLPENYDQKSEDEKKQIPVILMLHGYGQNAQFFKSITGFEKNACKRNYAVVYISGTKKEDTLHSDLGWHYSDNKQGKEDLDFFVNLTKYLQKKFLLSSKSFVVGFSNGAFMSTKIATQRSKYFLAIASVAGMMPDNVWAKTKSNNKIGFMQINGTKDSVAPMKKNGSNKYNPNPAIEDVIDYFVKSNNIKNEPKEQNLSPRASDLNYDNIVRWILIEGGGHEWPTETYTGLNINEVILDYFDNFL